MDIIEELVAAYRVDSDSHTVYRYISGPKGSGKTRTVLSLPENLLNAGVEESGFFIYLGSGQRDWDTIECDRMQSPIVLMSYYHPIKQDRSSKLSDWDTQDRMWPKLDLHDHEELHDSGLRDPRNWEILLEILRPRAYGRIVFIIDDFDSWNGTERWNWREGLDKLIGRLNAEACKLLILFTGEVSLRRLRGLSPPNFFPVNTRELLMRLPSDITVANAINDRLSEAPDSVRSQLEKLERVTEVRDVTGAYPILVQELLTQIIDQADSAKHWSDLLEGARNSQSFRTRLNCIYKHLSDSQKQILSLLIIAEETEQEIAAIRDTWEERSLNKVFSSSIMFQELEHLERRKLLLRSTTSTEVGGSGSFAFASSALQEQVSREPLTVGLRVETGLSGQSHRSRKQLTFLSWLTVGILWYVLIVVLQPVIVTIFKPEFLPFVLFAGFLPAIFYMLLQVLSARSSG